MISNCVNAKSTDAFQGSRNHENQSNSTYSNSNRSHNDPRIIRSIQEVGVPPSSSSPLHVELSITNHKKWNNPIE